MMSNINNGFFKIYFLPENFFTPKIKNFLKKNKLIVQAECSCIKNN